MATLLDWTADWLGDQLKTHAGRALTLTRKHQPGADPISVSLTAPVAKHDYQQLEQDSSISALTMYDWTITAADVVIDGAVTEPRIGDVLTDTATGKRYEVLPIGKGKAVEDLDPGGKLLLVHTKRIP